MLQGGAWEQDWYQWEVYPEKRILFERWSSDGCQLSEKGPPYPKKDDHQSLKRGLSYPGRD